MFIYRLFIAPCSKLKLVTCSYEFFKFRITDDIATMPWPAAGGAHCRRKMGREIIRKSRESDPNGINRRDRNERRDRKRRNDKGRVRYTAAVFVDGRIKLCRSPQFESRV